MHFVLAQQTDAGPRVSAAPAAVNAPEDTLPKTPEVVDMATEVTRMSH
jgi:hypothetical protein